MTEARLRQFLVRCDGARMPLSWRDDPWDRTLDVNSDPNAGAVNLVLRGFDKRAFPGLRPRTEDLLRIVTAAYRADEQVPRTSDADVHGEQWERGFGLCIAVRDPDFWEAEETQRRLASLLRFGTDDRWRFDFSPLRPRDPQTVQLSLDLSGEPVSRPPERVVLCSGGIDSLAALVEAAARGDRPVAIGHWASPPVRTRQHDLVQAVGREARRFGGWTVPSIGVRVSRLGAEARERTRRSRSALFAALGAAAAGELGIERVLLADNGPISLNLPINDQIVGARASRSTHPVLLRHATDLASLVYETPIRIENPLWARTRAEAIEVLTTVDLTSLLPMTLSCSNWGWGQRSADVAHCGYCSQCIDRRFATIASNMEEFDPPRSYARDVFLGPLPDGRATLLALGYVRFAQRVVGLTPFELISTFPQLTEAILPDDPDPDGTMHELTDLVERHARTVLRVVDDQREAARVLFSRGRVSATSLLVLSAIDPALSPRDGLPSPPEDRPAEPRHVPIATAPASGEAEIVFQDTEWVVTFQGRAVHLKPTEGPARLIHLLKHPGQRFSPGELYRATTGQSALDPAFVDGDADGLRVVVSEERFEIYDSEALSSFRQEIATLTKEISAARATGDEATARAKEEQRANIQRHRNEGTRPGNLPQHFDTAQDTVDDTVYQSLSRLLKKLDSRHPPLALHLRRCLTIGVNNCYAPEPGVRWRITHPPKAA